MTRYDERDELIARALRELPTPEHGPTFWADLERRLNDDREPALVAASLARAADDPPVHRLDTGELPSVASLEGAARRRRGGSRRAILTVAAAVVILVAAVGVATLAMSGDGDDDGTELADQPSSEVTTTMTASSGDDPTVATSAPRSELTGTTSSFASGDLATPAGTVQAWIGALASGDVATAASLTGPVTTAYFSAEGTSSGGVEGYLTEAQEGYGAWAEVPTAEIAEIDAGEVASQGGQVVIVVITGANRGEGREEPTSTDVFPVVNRGDGWRVEPVAADPNRDTNIPIIQSPRAPSGESGFGTMNGDAAIEVIVPSSGVVLFKLDEEETFLRDTTGVGANDDPYARYDPAGTVTPGLHRLVVVGLGADGTIAAAAGTFTVSD